MLDQGVWAEVKVGGEQLRLFSEESALAVQESVHNIMQGTGLRPPKLRSYRTGKRQSGGTCSGRTVGRPPT
jgi:hypothetical protein